MARNNMLQRHICASSVVEENILDAIKSVKREKFVPEKYYPYSYSDIEIPLGFNQVMQRPKLIAQILQSLEINKKNKILEIGTGSGYLTSLLSLLGKQVTSIDIINDLVKKAANILKKQSYKNINVLVGNGLTYHYDGQTFDIIVLTGSIPYLYEELLTKLNVNGKMFAVIGKDPIMSATIFTKNCENTFVSNEIFEVNLQGLLNVPKTKDSSFVF